jgi:hypothetical protein
MDNTKCTTIVLTITAAGDQLVPMVVCKGTENGLIKKCKFALHDPMCIYERKDDVWMDKRVMLRWVEDVLATYISLTPPEIMPYILLDLYQCHVMAVIINVILDLGCKVVHIPGGCTKLVQPLEVGYNKPFKTHICVCWEEHMINNMHRNESILMPSCLDVSAWVTEAYWDLEKSPIVRMHG